MGKSFWVNDSKGLFFCMQIAKCRAYLAFGECCRGLLFSVLMSKPMLSFVQAPFSANVQFDTSNRKSDN